jgi:hypothetical protein
MTTIFFSKIPGEEVSPPELPELEMYALRRTPTNLVITSRWTYDGSGWKPHSPLFSESFDLAREMVPSEENFEREECPAEFADEVWVRRRR